MHFASPRDERFLSDLVSSIERNLGEGHFSVASLSKDLGLSRPQLYRKSKELTGRSPKELIDELKLSQVPGLIRQNQKNISEIAYEVGYNHPSSFSKNFKRRFGISPSQASKILLG